MSASLLGDGQADVCHAYQLLKRDGLKDENIVVMMYDDIADNEENPYPGTIINHPNGLDVYAGVPKVCASGVTTKGGELCFFCGPRFGHRVPSHVLPPF